MSKPNPTWFSGMRVTQNQSTIPPFKRWMEIEFQSEVAYQLFRKIQLRLGGATLRQIMSKAFIVLDILLTAIQDDEREIVLRKSGSPDIVIPLERITDPKYRG